MTGSNMKGNFEEVVCKALVKFYSKMGRGIRDSS